MHRYPDVRAFLVARDSVDAAPALAATYRA